MFLVSCEEDVVEEVVEVEDGVDAVVEPTDSRTDSTKRRHSTVCHIGLSTWAPLSSFPVRWCRDEEDDVNPDVLEDAVLVIGATQSWTSGPRRRRKTRCMTEESQTTSSTRREINEKKREI